MGQLTQHYLETYAQGAKIFIETGTYKGDSIKTALDFGFESLYSVELNDKLFRQCCKRFSGISHLHLYCGDSPDVLQTILQNINSKCIFWLDAHYSYSLNTPGSEKYGPAPLLQELDSIAGSSINNHVIFIDDCRLFGTSSWGYLSKNTVLKKLYQINPNYKIEYLDGGQSFGFTNPEDDILVAYIAQ